MSRNAGMLATIHPPAHPPTVWATATTYAGRTVRQFVRTPQLLIVNAVTSTMFLLIFRFVFGGAIQTGPVKYVDFLIPALTALLPVSDDAIRTKVTTHDGLAGRVGCHRSRCHARRCCWAGRSPTRR